jgi:hypothetical protein
MYYAHHSACGVYSSYTENVVALNIELCKFHKQNPLLVLLFVLMSSFSSLPCRRKRHPGLALVWEDSRHYQRHDHRDCDDCRLLRNMLWRWRPGHEHDPLQRVRLYAGRRDVCHHMGAGRIKRQQHHHHNHLCQQQCQQYQHRQQ